MDESGPAALWRAAFPLGDGRAAVPEHLVKAALARMGVGVPDGRVTDSVAGVVDAAAGLTAPLVLKAWGPGLVHKSDVGAVRLGLDAGSIGAVALEMDRDLRVRGIEPAGFLVEEQQPSGVELIVGVVNRPDFGPVVLLGLGGTWTEVLDQAVVRLHPLDEAAAWEMLASFPGTRLLEGLRGAQAVDRAAIVSVLLALAGPGGLAERLGPELAELECNPVIATPKGATVVDARLVHAAAGSGEATAPAPSAPSLDRLFAPRTIGVVGASTSKLAFGNRFLRGYVRRGWRSGLYAIHPSADEVEGVPAVRSVADIPGGLDYLLVAVPAAACAQVIRESAGLVAFAQVMSGGFGEEGAAGARLEQDLLVAARHAGVRVVGPNCMGIYSPNGRQTWQLRDPIEPGPISVVSQSGGLAGDIIKGGEARGLHFSKLATVGNAIDVTPGELVEYFLEDPETEVIGLYLEGARDGARLLSALRRARGRKPVTVLVGALSSQGARAAASHTGAMTGDTRVWEAISRATGAAVVKTLEELLGTLAFHQRYADTAVADDPGVLLVGPGGGASILGADACDRAGLFLDPVDDATQQTLRSLGYGAGTSVANPIEVGIGPAAAADAFDAILDAILAAQPYPDVVLHFNVQSFYSQGDTGSTRLLEMLEHLADRRRPTRLAIVLRNLDTAPPADVAAIRDRAHRLQLPSFPNFDEAMTAIRAAKLFTAVRRSRVTGTRSPLGPDDLIITASTLGLPGFPDLVAAAVAGGFAGLSVWPEGVYRRAQAEGLSDATQRALLDDAGLVVQDVDAAVAWVGPGDPGPPYLEEPDRATLYAAARALGASFVNVLLVGRGGGGIADAAGAFAGVCDEAAEHGLVATLEFTYRGIVTTVSEAAAVVAAAGRPNGRLLVDTWQHHWGGSSLAQLAELPGGAVAAVQVSDAPGTRPSDLRQATRHGRLIPGEGVIDLTGVLRALRSTESTPPLTVEVLNEALLARYGPEGLARRLGAAMRSIVAASRTDGPAA